ncbi:MAG: glycosyltransferase family 4 protein [Anaerolineae bacterium]
MRIAFFGLRSAFDYHQIGGVESCIRRLAAQLSARGDRVEYLLFGAERTQVVQVPDCGLTLRYFSTFREALNSLKAGYDHVVTVYLPPEVRLPFALFRLQQRANARFHLIRFGFPRSPLKRLLALVDIRLFYACVFAISPRIFRAIEGMSSNPVLILPPVNPGYFLNPDEKGSQAKIKVTFAGRIDIGKGIEEVIDLFRKLQENPGVETAIYGYYSAEADTSCSRGTYEWLRRQTEIKYLDSDRKSYSLEAEGRLQAALRETDVLVLPYRQLSSTIDTPMLLLEGMASLCAIVTRRMGDIPSIYGESDFLLPGDGDLGQAFDLLVNISKDRLAAERLRIWERNQSLDFRAVKTAVRFRQALAGK